MATMTETFWRWHRADAPPFSAENAWSGLWGSEFSADGSRAQCRTCNGSGEGWRDCPHCHGDYDAMQACQRCHGQGGLSQCQDCEGEGWLDCVRGYFCCWTARELADYMTAHAGEPHDEWGRVVEFEGEHTDTGFDGEPTAVPVCVIHEMTWSQFKESLA